MSIMASITISLTDGKIEAVQKNDIVRARGINYATAKRFQKPLPLKPWTGVVSCTNPAAICPQPPSRYDIITGCLTDGHPLDEDCLNLSITCPASSLSPGAKLPVLVFFHGGAYVAGGGDTEAGNTIGLSSCGAVVVSVTYRLGCFGYLYVDGVSPANLGLMDQISALQWVQKNITAFGGDSNNVTIFGQSAGGDAVFCLLGADETDDLFHKAIIQSAPLGREFHREKLLKGMGEVAEKYMSKERLQIASDEEIVKLQDHIITAARNMSGGASMPFGPCCGHAPLPDETELRKRIVARASKMPFLIGWTSEEAKPYIHLIPQVLALTQWPIFGSLVERVFTYYITGKVFVWPAQTLKQELITAGGSPVTYSFNWGPPNSPFGVAHAIDLAFLFGDWNTWKDAPFLMGASSEKVVETVGPQVKALWIAFATGEDLGQKHFDIGEDFQWKSTTISETRR
jgi:para-nitrobenzyl esterase